MYTFDSMSMTLNQIAVLIAERAKRQLDIPFRDMIKDRAKYWRSRLIKDAINKDPGRRKFFLQSLTLPLVRRSAAECGIPLDCYLMETVSQVPTPITANKLLYEFVGMPDGMSSFSWVERSWLKYKSHDKYSGGIKNYTFLNKRIQVYAENIPYVLIEGVFDDPEEVERLRCSSEGIACDYDNTPFSAPNDIVQLIIQSIMTIDLGIVQDKEIPETQVPVNEDK